jgi:hypothetical protein
MDLIAGIWLSTSLQMAGAHVPAAIAQIQLRSYNGHPTEDIMKRCLLLLSLCIFLISCNQLASFLNPQAAVPDEILGEFYCSGHEHGLLAFAGNLILRDDGSVELEWMYAGSALEGTWSYDAVSAQVTFSSDLEISHARYNDAVESLEVHLREGVEQAHVETGVMYCEKQ